MEGLLRINGKGLISFRGVYSCQAYPYQFLVYNDAIESPSTMLTAFARIISSAGSAAERGKAIRLESAMIAKAIITLKGRCSTSRRHIFLLLEFQRAED